MSAHTSLPPCPFAAITPELQAMADAVYTPLWEEAVRVPLTPAEEKALCQVVMQGNAAIRAATSMQEGMALSAEVSRYAVMFYVGMRPGTASGSAAGETHGR